MDNTVKMVCRDNLEDPYAKVVYKNRKRVTRKPNFQIELNDDYYVMFIPFYYVDTVFGLRTYNLKNGLATPMRNLDIFLGVLGCFIMLASMSFSLKWSNFPNFTTTIIYSIQYSVVVFLYLVQPIVNTYFKNEYYVLLMKFQEVGRMVKNYEGAKALSVFVWTFLVLITLYYGFFIWISWTSDVHWIWPRVIMILSSIVFEMKILHISMIMLYLKMKLNEWKIMCMCYEIDEFQEVRQKLRQLEFIFENILMSYSVAKKVSQVFIFVCFVMAFFEFLLLEAFFLIWAGWEPDRYGELSPMNFLVYGWMIKIVVIEIILCICCEVFYVEITNVREAVILKTFQVAPRCHESQSFEDLKEFAKLIGRLIDSHFTKMRACSVFTVDAGLLLRFLATVATYTVVLLQFAF